MDLGAHRRDYETHGLDLSDVLSDPLDQFRAWYQEAVAADVYEADAMVLATVSAEGEPNARYVLLRGLDEHGFAFYTNAQSIKGRELAANPRAALTFGWLALHRQVRVQGTVAPLALDVSDAYFASRPRGHRIGAWASPQSEVLADRSELERRVRETEERFPGEHVPRPPHWGGWALAPHEVEFWQGRRDRLHDRLRYRRADGGWLIERLAP